MPLSSGHAANPEHLAELDRELEQVRELLLSFAEERELLPGLVAREDADPLRRHPDVEHARVEATVDELLWVVGRTPHENAEPGEDEAHPLYPALLSLAEAFDILIDQFSLVYGDAISLAEATWPGWHEMSGCHGHEATPEQASDALARMRRNAEALPDLLARSEALNGPDRELVGERFAGWGDGALAREARHLARHALETWMPHGVEDPRIAAALADSDPAADPFRRATADLLLAGICLEGCRPVLGDALTFPFAIPAFR